MQKSALLFIVIVAALVLVGGGFYAYKTLQELKPPSETTSGGTAKRGRAPDQNNQKPQVPSPTQQSPTVETPHTKLASCGNLGGNICSETAEETCSSTWLETSDSKRCCAIKCVSQPVYTKSPETGKVNVRNCYPNENKNKVAVIIKENGIYDNSAVNLAVSSYLAAVKKDIGIESAGLKKFTGASMPELSTFVDGLYLRENAAYIILAGDDLPNSQVTEGDQTNENVVLSGLAFVRRGFEVNACQDIAFSQIVPRLLDQESGKVNFVISRFNTYAKYHLNPSFYLDQYQRRVLRVKHDPEALQIGMALPFSPLGYGIPTKEVFNSNHEAVRSALSEKSLIARFDVHGSENLVGIGINSKNLPADDYFAYYTTPEEYSNFLKNNGSPSLFVDAGSCQATTIKYRDEKFCCWPQTFLESDVWAYYSYSQGQDAKESKAMLEEPFIGKAVRKTSPVYFIFGDILARLGY